MEDLRCYDIVVIGQGYAGLTAAGMAAEHGLRAASIEGGCAGGLIMNINHLDPAPQSGESMGAECVGELVIRNIRQGVKSISETVNTLERDKSRGCWLIQTKSGIYAAPNVIVASGARLRKLGIPGEEEFYGNGVSECADCDGPMFTGMETVVIGGGDSAFQEAHALAEYASKVTILMRGQAPRARREFVERIAQNPKVTQMINTRVLEIEGTPESGVQRVRIKTDQGERALPARGVFIFIGLEPNTNFLSSEVKRDASGAVITSEKCNTSLPGLWAIGAVRSGFGGELTDADADAERVVSALNLQRANMR